MTRMPEVRKDPITGSWVVSAPERAQRPQPTKIHATASHSKRCPFCAGHEADTPPEIFSLRHTTTEADQPGWSVRVVPNRYPALVAARSHRRGSNSFYESDAAFGAHEVIIETPKHIENISKLNDEQFTRVVRAYRQRMRALSENPTWRYLLLFKNQGIAAGATLGHVHSQLLALSIIPPETAREIAGARKFFERHRSCGYCAMMKREAREKHRLITSDAHYAVFCPYAARVPFETWIVPRRHQSLFANGAEGSENHLARVLRETLRRLDRALKHAPFNLIIRSSPPALDENPYYHWHIEILPRLAQIGGFEWGTGCYINVVTPEDAARQLRKIAL